MGFGRARGSKNSRRKGTRSSRRLVRVASALTAMVTIGFLAVVAGSGPAVADPTSAPLCKASGTSLSGRHHDLVVRGNAYVADGATLKVSGNLTVAPGGCLDAFSLGTVVVGHNVLVGHGATLALGCAPGSNGPPPILPCGFTTTKDKVGGSILAVGPKTMYLTAVTVGHDVISVGGGPGTKPSTIGVSFPVKGMDIHGDLIMQGWHGGWIGALRNQVGGNLIFVGNTGNRPDDSGAPDSSEIDGNTVGHNLICLGNTPSARFGDAPPPTSNTVGGHKIGECANL